MSVNESLRIGVSLQLNKKRSEKQVQNRMDRLKSSYTKKIKKLQELGIDIPLETLIPKQEQVGRTKCSGVNKAPITLNPMLPHFSQSLPSCKHNCLFILSLATPLLSNQHIDFRSQPFLTQIWECMCVFTNALTLWQSKDAVEGKASQLVNGHTTSDDPAVEEDGDQAVVMLDDTSDVQPCENGDAEPTEQQKMMFGVARDELAMKVHTTLTDKT